MLKVLMVGPDRTVQGGVSGVVNNYYKAGLDKKVGLKYIGTMVDGSKLAKLMKAISSYIQFRLVLGQYDIVHVNMAADASFYRKSFFIKAALRKHKKLVIHQHGGDVKRFYGSMTGKKREKMVQLLNSCDAFLVLAPILYDFFRNIIDENKLHLLPNGVIVPDYDIETKDYSNKNLLFLGRICADKGINELIEAAEHLHFKYPDMKLTLGGFFEEADLKHKCLSHPDYISCPGWIKGEDKISLLKNSSIFVLPSYFEGMPLSPIEAMSYGCACAVTAVGGMQQIFNNSLGIFGDVNPEDTQSFAKEILIDASNSDAVLYNAKDATSLEAALDLLLSSDELRKQIGHNGRTTVLEKYDLKLILDSLMEIYNTL